MQLHEKVLRVEQGTEEWRRLRMGRPSASRFSNFINFAKKSGSLSLSDSLTAKSYKFELVAEKLLQRPMDRQKPDTPYMKDGRKYEPYACDWLAAHLKVDVLPGGFFTNGIAGCSPDRLLADRNEIVEVKCPAPWTHLQYIVDGFDDAYELQVQGQLWITGADICHFCSWSPEEGFPAVYIKRTPDRIFIKTMEILVRNFSKAIIKAEKEAIDAGVVPIPESNQ